MPVRTFARPATAAWLLVALSGAAVVFATQLYAWVTTQGSSVAYGDVLLLQLGHWYLWFGAAPVTWAAARRWPFTGARRYTSLARHVVLAMAMAGVILATYGLYYCLLVRWPIVTPLFGTFDRDPVRAVAFFVVSFFHLELLVYAAIVAVHHVMQTSAALSLRERDAARLRAERDAARLQALQAQLRPHFLFNTLHTINSFVLQQRTAQATSLLAELGALLRMTLDDGAGDVVPLRREIEYLRMYLGIEQARFDDRLAVEWHVAPDALDVPVPAFILQPIIENALRHGLARTSEHSRLIISGVVTDERVCLSVFNDGPQLPAGWTLPAHAGVGLRNVTGRIQIWSPASQFSLENTHDGVLATLSFPRTRHAPEVMV